MAIDWNDDAKLVVTTGLEAIPEVGEILGPLVDIFWPSTKEDVWGEIKAQVEALVDKKISDLVYGQVTDDLTGLKNALTDYLQAAQSGDTANTKMQWIATKTVFDTSLPHFQSAGYELLLSPLFAQFGNMYLSLLRDGVLFGASWGWNTAYQQQIATDLKTSIGDFYGYGATTFNNGRLNVAKATKANYHECQPFKAINTYDRQMNLTVLDYMAIWPYFDATVYPNGAKFMSTREIYSDPMGTCDDSGNIVLALPEPTQPISSITVRSAGYINAVQVTYPEGGGPGGATQTTGGNTSAKDNHFEFDLTNKPITLVEGAAGSIVNSLKFTYSDGSATGQMAGGGGNPFSFSYPGQVLSSIHINGVSAYYNCADCVVFGFTFQQDRNVSLETLQKFYVTSPKERSAADFAKAFPNAKISGDLITKDLQAARKTHWAAIKAQAEASKVPA